MLRDLIDAVHAEADMIQAYRRFLRNLGTGFCVEELKELAFADLNVNDPGCAGLGIRQFEDLFEAECLLVKVQGLFHVLRIDRHVRCKLYHLYAS